MGFSDFHLQRQLWIHLEQARELYSVRNCENLQPGLHDQIKETSYLRLLALRYVRQVGSPCLARYLQMLQLCLKMAPEINDLPKSDCC